MTGQKKHYIHVLTYIRIMYILKGRSKGGAVTGSFLNMDYGGTSMFYLRHFKGKFRIIENKEKNSLLILVIV